MSEADSRKQVLLDVKCLRILRCMIYNSITLIDPELKERDPEQYRRCTYTYVRTGCMCEYCVCIFYRQCSSKLHPIQGAIQNIGNALARVRQNKLCSYTQHMHNKEAQKVCILPEATGNTAYLHIGQ